MKVITDRRVKNAVLRQVRKENDICEDDLYCNSDYHYMEYSNNVRITLLRTIYKGNFYAFEYFSGCFNAFMVTK